MGSVESHQRNRAESEGGPGRVDAVTTRRDYFRVRLYLFSRGILYDFQILSQRYRIAYSLFVIN
jgi:hypothetical protein